ncbi:MAG TPA: IS21 family transposase [Solirubrobacteraceae bacterium]|nr:IS21 family transposase [Solirubrobacteraceae bacterium]
MIEPELVRRIRALEAMGWGSKRIARELGVALMTVKRYRRGGAEAEAQRRPTRRALDDEQRARARELFDTTAEGNAVVVTQLLAEAGIDVDIRVVQRVLQPHRQTKRAAEAATVRFETEPGHQLQIDFGEKHVMIAGQRTRVLLFVAVLGYSRRCYVRAFRSQRHDDWREGLAAAFQHFGGVTQTVLVDNAKALIVDRVDDVVRVNPAFEAFCKDWGVAVRACRPYRARTKGKTERGVGYAKHNALAGRQFASWAALEAHLAWWMQMADERDHGTTHEAPRVRFERAEASALKPLPARPIPVRQRREQRKVASDCFVDVDTVRYSVPHRLVGRTVQVLVGDDEVVIFDVSERVARHSRCREPHQRVVDPAHFEGLHRVTTSTLVTSTVLAPYGRSLADYAAHVRGAR